MALLKAAADVTIFEYAMLVCALLVVLFYRAFHFHFFEDLLTAFRGYPLQFIHNSNCPLASGVLPRCRLLSSRYFPTPWLCSPHLQTAFLHFFARRRQFEYHRKLCRTPDGGTVALDWLFPKKGSESCKAVSSSEHDSLRETRIVVIVPGLTSDSSNTYVKELAYSLAVSGWRVVVANHRGLGGVSITSNQFYNAGWTTDLRTIIQDLHQAYPKTPIFAVGTSLGANILVKYLGEEGGNTPLGGAVAICCPWDLLVCDRFICREWIQRFYDKILACGLRAYAAVHQVVLSQIADWDLIYKSRSVRDFDNHCTCVIGQFETVDTYYRKNSSAAYLHSVSIPLFCLNALDDPVCTKEAIPWDECRVNANLALGISKHGGHLAFFEGMAAGSMWWIRAVNEFLENLSASSIAHFRVTEPGSFPQKPLLLDGFTKGPSFSDSYRRGLVAMEQMQENVDNPPQIPKKDTPMDHAKARRVLPGTGNAVGGSFFPIYEENIVNEVLAPECDRLPKTYVPTSSSVSSESSADFHHSTLKLSVQSHSQLLTLESALTQLLEQVQLLKQVGYKVGKGSEHSTLLCNEANTESEDVRPSQQSIESHQTADSGKASLASFYKKKWGLGHGNNTTEVSTKVVARQNRESLWLLAYIAIITTWPLIGSALFIQGKRRVKDLLSRLVSK